MDIINLEAEGMAEDWTEFALETELGRTETDLGQIDLFGQIDLVQAARDQARLDRAYASLAAQISTLGPD
ncbi:MAG: hypothetical protein ACRYFS_14160, partial [Janthinobacterium lividum]